MGHTVGSESEKRIFGKFLDAPPGERINLLVSRFFLIPTVVASHMVNRDKDGDRYAQFVENTPDVCIEAVVGVVEGDSGNMGIVVAFANVGVHIGELPVLLHITQLPLEVFGGDGIETGFFVHVMVHQNHSDRL